MVLGKLDIHMQRNEIGPLPYPYRKIISKLAKKINSRPKTIEFLEENLGGELDISLGNHFLDMKPKAQAPNAKNS